MAGFEVREVALEEVESSFLQQDHIQSTRLVDLRQELVADQPGLAT